jgi:aminopeptidase-like protein
MKKGKGKGKGKGRERGAPMFRKLFDMIGAQISGTNALDLITHIHDHDRWSSFDRHHEAALYCLRKMEEYGLEAEIFELPADGEKRYGDWVMPRAWKARSAELKLLLGTEGGEDGREVKLCDYSEDPCSLVIYSKPTPPEGITAELVIVEGGSKAEDYEGLEVEGKVVFTRDSARASRLEAMRHGALGIVSDHLPIIDYYRPPMELPDCRYWDRFSSDFGGWGMKKGDPEFWGFVLTPRQGHWLREMIGKGRRLRVHAKIDASFYDGSIDVVTGCIRGETDEEVLINGHLYEVGAIDDASGCGLAIEVLRCLNTLIRSGRLGKPRRGIRMLFTYECMGTMGALLERPDLFQRTVAGITLDCVGGKEALCRAFLGLSRNPHAQASYTDTLLRLILEHSTRTDKRIVNWREIPFLKADNMIADPSIGIPCPLLIEYPYTFYHSSMDTPDKLDHGRLEWIGRAVATYAYFIANAGEPEAQWLLSEVLSEAQKAMIDELEGFLTPFYEGYGALGKKADGEGKGEGEREGEEEKVRDAKVLEKIWRRLSYQKTRYGIAIDSVARLSGTERLQKLIEEAKEDLGTYASITFERAAKELGLQPRKPRKKRWVDMDEYDRKASHIVPKRLVLESCQMTRIPAEERKEWRRKCHEWRLRGEIIQSAQMWCDGIRTVAEIEDLVEGETGESDVRLLDYFKEMERYGYIKCEKRH